MRDRDIRRAEIEARLEHLYNTRHMLETRIEMGEGHYTDLDVGQLEDINNEITMTEQLRDFS